MLPPGYLFVALAGMVFLNLFMPVLVLAPYPWNAIGLIPLAMGIILNLVAGRVLMKLGNTIRPLEPPQRLVTGSIYRFSRNPMYLGMVLMLTGAAILLGTLTPFIIIPIFMIAMDRVFVCREEDLLEARFGDEWKDYRRNVRRWL